MINILYVKKKVRWEFVEERLNKFIASCGVCSRRRADEYITNGQVTVNGVVITELGTKVSANDVIAVNDEVINKEKEIVYILINKPVGYVTTSKEQFNRPCVLDLIKEKKRVYSVGRLDMFSEGMLILTNDGELVNKIIHPKVHVCKTYEVEVNKTITKTDAKKMASGVDIGGYITKRAEVEILYDNTLKLTIYEGKNRQIRKMCESLGYKVRKLKRISIGKLELGNLKMGEYRYLNIDEVNKMFE